MLKKTLFTASVLSTFLLGSVPVLGADIEILINQMKVAPNPAPIIQDNRTYVPLRLVAETMGYEVGYVDAEKKVTVKSSDTNLEMVIGESNAKLNSETLSLDAPPFISNNSTFVPIRFISESFGARVDWDDYESKVLIYSDSPIQLKSKNASIYSIFGSETLAFEESQDEYLPDTEISYSYVIPQFTDVKNSVFQAELNDFFKEDAESVAYFAEFFLEEEGLGIFNDEINYSILSDTENILSIEVAGYEYTGGAHGSPYKYVANIDFKNSKILEYQDLFKEGVDFETILFDKLKEKWETHEQNESDYEVPEFSSYEYSFYFDSGNLVVFYPPYTLGYYAQGFIEIKIPLSELSDYLVDDYKNL